MTEKGDCILTFFGCFSPPTNGHLAALAAAYDHMKYLGYNVLKCIIIPAHGGYSTLKPGLMDAPHRVEMCRIITKDSDFIEVDSVEADKDHWSRTIDTLGYFRGKYPGVKILLICGIDTIDVFETKWREPDVIRILEEFGLVVLPRDNDTLDNLESHCKYLPGRMQNIYKINKNPMNEVSSTLVREKLEKKERVDGLVSHDVIKYIYDNHLYNT
ncbi:Cytidylyltransferase family protein [Tritrichomonas foetus]|uniref:Nicotinamide-nucleotide adenylyltransferase n=1 Tax=Tritrichomonas foetus TaxID=1144522 RepID=A0A1J4K526_9EUKA|nr:Cytidylyltransferase family protein [Tritrichomonas foetus]|eukprot:OHT06082.1 Cytidylyltransferase family protein [Tritrichomonas foetus]